MKRIIPVLCLAGCYSVENVGLTTSETFEVSARLPTPLDVLIVLDDTTAMAPHLPRRPDPANLSGVLQGIYNGAPDLRIAVTTTTTGTLRTSAAVPTGVVVHSVDFTDGSLDTNYPGTLASALGSVMNVGAISEAQNAALASTQRALHECSFRASASLGILLVTASDDRSTDDVAAYAAAIQATGKPAMVSAVHATPVQRIAEFADAFAYRWMMPIDSYNMSAIEVFAQLFDHTERDWCLPLAAVGGNPVAEGDVIDCELVTKHDGVVRSLPRCNGDPWSSAEPCWAVGAESSCTSGMYLGFGGSFRMYHPRVAGSCVVR